MSEATAAVGLLDTCTLIRLASLDVDNLPAQGAISTVTLAELSVGPLLAATDADRVERLAHLQQAESDFYPIPFDDNAARAFGRVSASLRASGRKTSARAFDALIAATAIANDMSLYTTNPDDFLGIDSLDLVAVPEN